MYRTDKQISPDMAIEELEKLISDVCVISDKDVADKERFHSRCEEIGYVIRNRLYRDGLIGTGNGITKMI